VRQAADFRLRLPSEPREKSAPLLPRGMSLDLSRLVVIGGSTGGTEAIRDIVTQLPHLIPPMIVVQHLSPEFTPAFARRLNGLTPFQVREARDGDPLHPGEILIAPGGMHAVVTREKGELLIRLHDGPAVDHHKPSIDLLFESVAQHADRPIGVLLTGMGRDGAQGLSKMRQKGARTLVQDEATSVVFGMPGAAIELGAAEKVCPLGEIPQVLIEWLRKPERVRK
jgi:two-component system chemotaxis response regulator CheB